jgi:hypothetical protein
LVRANFEAFGMGRLTLQSLFPIEAFGPTWSSTRFPILSLHVLTIREETRDGEELVDYMLSVFRDETASQRDRIEPRPGSPTVVSASRRSRSGRRSRFQTRLPLEQ